MGAHGLGDGFCQAQPDEVYFGVYDRRGDVLLLNQSGDGFRLIQGFACRPPVPAGAAHGDVGPAVG